MTFKVTKDSMWIRAVSLRLQPQQLVGLPSPVYPTDFSYPPNRPCSGSASIYKASTPLPSWVSAHGRWMHIILASTASREFMLSLQPSFFVIPKEGSDCLVLFFSHLDERPLDSLVFYALQSSQLITEKQGLHAYAYCRLRRLHVETIGTKAYCGPFPHLISVYTHSHQTLLSSRVFIKILGCSMGQNSICS